MLPMLFVRIRFFIPFDCLFPLIAILIWIFAEVIEVHALFVSREKSESAVPLSFYDIFLDKGNLI